MPRPAPKASPQPPGTLLGAHFSIAKGLHHAVYEATGYGCTALQIFTKNAGTWKERTVSQKEIDLFEKARTDTGISQIAAHTAYLINIASIEKKKYAISCHALSQEMVRASALGIPYVILHPGSHMGTGVSAGIKLIADSLNRIFDALPPSKSRLLLETTAGQGTNIGHTFEQIASIMARVTDKDRIGACLDTCHIFAAGYDIRTRATYAGTMAAFDRIVGLENLYLIHVNDSKKAFGSRIDRHEHVGVGLIGSDGFGFLMNDNRFARIPKIIETPKTNDGKDYDFINLDLLRSLIKGPKTP
ncbi:MAG: deoxyribonuclease IV [Deltaproteobacteria bacterium]|nr:deoxyribonuclease IV [Deltaproteobacteria bacterium]